MLRTHPEVSNLADPAMWMSCDDDRAPIRCLHPSQEFSKGLTCLWLCRADRMELHHLPAQPSTPDPELDLLALLATQPDPEP